MLSGGSGKLSWQMSACLSISGELLTQNIESSKSQKDEFLYDSCVPRKVGFEDWMVGSYEEEKGTMYTFEQLISKLTKREQDIIRKRYVDNRTQCDIAESMGCTRENVRSIESKALRKLRRMLKNRDL